MKKVTYISLGILLIILVLFFYEKPTAYAKNWSKEKTDKIIVSNMTTVKTNDSDTVQLTKNDVKLINTLAGGILYKKDSLTNSNEEATSIIYDIDNSASYEIRRWENGTRSFNGVRVNEKYQGWCEWFYKNGQIAKEGALIDSEPVGTWNYYSESGQIDSTINYGRSYIVYFKLNN